MTDVNNNDNIPDEEEEVEIHYCEWCDAGHEELNEVSHSFGRGVRSLCDECSGDSFRCSSCDDVLHDDDASGIDFMCRECYYDNYYECESCGDMIHREDACQSCTANGHVHDYSYRPDPLFFIGGDYEVSYNERRDMSLTGFELEMEATLCDRSDGAELASELFGKWCYLKHDGSLNNGFEMVSHPMAHAYLIEKFPFDDLKKLSELGMRSSMTRTCGLHVHINRAFFGKNPTTLYRFMSMFYRNPEQWKRIAGRENSSYANWSEYELERMLEYTKGLAQGRHERNHDRYVALNLQNRNTIELRFFKGTLSPSSLAGRVEAVHAVAHYAYATRNNVSIKAAHDWERFREWTIANKYNAFNNYASIKGV